MIRTSQDQAVEVRPGMRGGKGEVTIKHYFKQDEIKAKCRFCARLVLPPGASIGPHRHETEDEIYIIERGTGLLDEGARKVKVGPGDAVLTGGGASHAIENCGAEPLEIIAVIMSY